MVLVSRTFFYERIDGLISEIKRLESKFNVLSLTDPCDQWENFNTLSIDAAIRAESFAIRTRSLVTEITSMKKRKYLTIAAEAHGISIVKNDEVYTIRLPKLLPGKKQKQNKFLLEPLYAALNDYFEKNGFDDYIKDCLINISFIYSKDFPERSMMDYDNIETKQVIDAIATFFVIDDSGKYVDIYYTSRYGESECTEINIMPKSHFTEWLINQNK